jgi:DNA-binding CsgD family transcriptional regulator
MSIRARLLAATGRADEARRVLDDVTAFHPDGLPELVRLECAVPAAATLLSEGASAAALEAATTGLEVAAPHVALRLTLAAIGVRAAADLAVRARARRDPRAAEQAAEAAGVCLAEVTTQRQILSGWQPPTPSKLAVADLVDAEGTRLRGTSEPARWADVAHAFDAAGLRYQAAYATYRHAEALFQQGGVRVAEAPAILRTAYATSIAIGATPLAREIEVLAGQARVDVRDLGAPAAMPVAAPPPADGPRVTAARAVAAATAGSRSPRPARERDETARVGPRLSARERQVLALVAAGRTNGQIALELFISTKTASVHVTHILDKLGAGNRVEAAMIAARAGLLEGGS